MHAAKEPKQLRKEVQMIIGKVAECYDSMDTLVHRYFTLAHACNVTLSIIYRPKWIVKNGSKYSYLDYVIIGWQEDDLPLFGRVEDIFVVNNNTPLFHVLKYVTLGIDRHYHSFCIKKTDAHCVCWLSELIDYHPMQAHNLSNSNLYITFRSHIEKLI